MTTTLHPTTGQALDSSFAVNDHLFVIGAGDPEMDRIEEILDVVDANKVRASAPDGERVNPGTAYTAAHITTQLLPVFVECCVNDLEPHIVIDHHREGDPGYDLGPEHYWEASSIGQLCTLLEVEPEPDDRVLAAMDHCFAAALHGECPGIEPEAVLDLKTELIAESKNLTTNEVRQRIDQDTLAIQQAATIAVGGYPVADLRNRDLGRGYSLENLTMSIAQAITGLPLLLNESDVDGRQKTTIDSSNTAQVLHFMNYWAPEQGLVEVYGVPARGYAGGYLSGTAA